MPSAEAKQATLTSAKASLSIFAISVGISLFTAAYEKALEPLFGSVATSKYISYAVHGSTALGVILPKLPRPQLLLALAILLQLAPHTSYWISVFASRDGDPILGPALTHATVLVPVIYLAVALAASIDFMLATMVLAANALQLRPLILLVAHELSLDTRKDAIFLTLASLTLMFWTSTQFDLQTKTPGRTLLSSAKKLWTISIPIAVFLFPLLRSPTLSGSGILPYESQDHTLRILSSTESVTGVVVVGELLPLNEETNPAAVHSIRYLRAAHSIVGGVWVGSKIAYMDNVPPRTDQSGTPIGDSIYSAFVLQEAARLVNSTPQGKAGKWENALVIGLGAGISADAFVRHGISTTVVEIDPAVYDAASKYFGLELPDNDRVFLEDARNWCRKRIDAMQFEDGGGFPRFDIVVHDCFSGGRVPQHLFSAEFWEDVKAIMSPEGVVAVNFAGKVASEPTRAVVTTLLNVFGQCRAFHDVLDPTSEDQSHADFLNMVFFCSPSSLPLTFRPSVDEDYLHSYLRRYVLSSLDKREVPISQIRGTILWTEETEKNYVLSDMNNTLDEWQHEDALDHWKLMRKILPDILWETY